MKVMIVEDNPSLRSMIRSVLELGHADVAETTTASQAFRLYGTYRPDWVLVDMSVSGSDGIELTERLMRIHPDANVMIVTDVDSLTLRRKARRAGVGGILVKENLFRDLQRTDFQLLANVRLDLKS